MNKSATEKFCAKKLKSISARSHPRQIIQVESTDIQSEYLKLSCFSCYYL